MAFCLEHPKWDQNPKLTHRNETTSIPTPFICPVFPGHPASHLSIQSRTSPSFCFKTFNEGKSRIPKTYWRSSLIHDLSTWGFLPALEKGPSDCRCFLIEAESIIQYTRCASQGICLIIKVKLGILYHYVTWIILTPLENAIFLLRNILLEWRQNCWLFSKRKGSVNYQGGQLDWLGKFWRWKVLAILATS